MLKRIYSKDDNRHRGKWGEKLHCPTVTSNKSKAFLRTFWSTKIFRKRPLKCSQQITARWNIFGWYQNVGSASVLRSCHIGVSRRRKGMRRWHEERMWGDGVRERSGNCKNKNAFVINSDKQHCVGAYLKMISGWSGSSKRRTASECMMRKQWATFAMIFSDRITEEFPESRYSCTPPTQMTCIKASVWKFERNLNAERTLASVSFRVGELITACEWSNSLPRKFAPDVP